MKLLEAFSYLEGQPQAEEESHGDSQRLSIATMSAILVLPEGELDGVDGSGVVSSHHIDVTVAYQQYEGAGAIHGAEQKELNRAGHDGPKGTVARVCGSTRRYALAVNQRRKSD
jgi:hypothetical protein